MTEPDTTGGRCARSQVEPGAGGGAGGTVTEVDLKPHGQGCRRGRLLRTYWVPVWRMARSAEDSRAGKGLCVPSGLGA